MMKKTRIWNTTNPVVSWPCFPSGITLVWTPHTGSGERTPGGGFECWLTDLERILWRDQEGRDLPFSLDSPLSCTSAHCILSQQTQPAAMGPCKTQTLRERNCPLHLMELRLQEGGANLYLFGCFCLPSHSLALDADPAVGVQREVTKPQYSGWRKEKHQPTGNFWGNNRQRGAWKVTS